MIIDTHAHIFPDAIAEKASRSISKFYGIPMAADGRLNTLLRLEKAAGVERVVICSAATTAGQTGHINDYTAQVVREHPGFLYGLGAMHQDTPNKGAEVARIRKMGLRGVKIHPDIQGVAMNDRRFDELYEALSQLDMPLLCHTGDSRYHNSNPPEFLDVLHRFPHLKVIGAHLGCWSDWSRGVERLQKMDQVWVDCSSSLYALSPVKARSIIRAYGAERVLFGSDYPMWDVGEELKKLDALGLNDDEIEKIHGLNAQRLLGIT